MNGYGGGDNALSLRTLFQFEGEAFSMPSTLILEPGDKIRLYEDRDIIVKEPFSLLLPLESYEHFVFDVVSYFVTGTYLRFQNKDPDFFTEFNRVFTLSGDLPFTTKEIVQNVLAEDPLIGDKAEDYFSISPQTRQTFLDSTGNAYKT